MLSLRGNLTAWKNGLSGASPSSTEGRQKSCIWGGITPCTCRAGGWLSENSFATGPAAKAADSTLSCIRKRFGGKLREVILLYSALLMLHPGTGSCPGLPSTREMNLLLQVQNRTTKRIPHDLNNYVILTKKLLRWQKSCIVNL